MMQIRIALNFADELLEIIYMYDASKLFQADCFLLKLNNNHLI